MPRVLAQCRACSGANRVSMVPGSSCCTCRYAVRCSAGPHQPTCKASCLSSAVAEGSPQTGTEKPVRFQSPEISSTSSTSRRRTALPAATMLPKLICCLGFWMSRRLEAAQYHLTFKVHACGQIPSHRGRIWNGPAHSDRLCSTHRAANAD